MGAGARANGGTRSSTSSSHQACGQLSNVRLQDCTKEQPSPGPGDIKLLDYPGKEQTKKLYPIDPLS